MRQILASHWFYDIRAYIGVVAARTGMHDPEKGEWMAYIGQGLGNSQEADSQHIADYGQKLQPRIAAAFFPHLDISKYKGAGE